MNEADSLIESMNSWGFAVNARIAFNKFIKAIEKENGVTDEVQKIFNIIDDIVLGKEKEQFIVELTKNSRYYRARIINAEDDGDLSKGIGKTTEGKFQGYNEVNSREPLHIIDFASDKQFTRSETEFHGVGLGVFFSQLMLRYTEPVRGEKAYKVTQTVSDYLRKTGIDGIAYRSFLALDGINYTIFNSHPHKIRFCGSKVVLHKQANHSFWDFNDEQEIMSNRNGKLLTWDNEIASKHKEHLSKRFKNV